MNTGGLLSGSQNPEPEDRASSSQPQPGVTVYETESLVVVEVEMPAIEEESLYLEISGNSLIIRGNRLSPKKSNHGRTAKRSDKEVHRCIPLPVIARPGEVRARLNGNIIRVVIRKRHAVES